MKVTAEEINLQSAKRFFLQWGGARPGNPVVYGGQDGQYLKVEGVSAPESGGVNPVWVPDPRRKGKFRMVGSKASPPDMPSASLVMLESKGSIPRQLQKINCRFNLYEVIGDCKDMSSFLSGWANYILIYDNALVTSKDLGDRSAWDSDNQIEDSLTLSIDDIYPIGPLNFGEKANTDIGREVVDIVYAPNEECGDCGRADDGTQRIYAITKSSGAGSPGLPAELIYSLDGGLTWNKTNITGFGATEDPLAIDVVGDRLVIIGEGSYFWCDLNVVTGEPGAFTEVTTGFVAAHDPNDLFVLSPREVFFVGDGGYIYRATDITAGVTVIDAGSTTTSNLYRIHGDGSETMVAVGAASTAIVTSNRGQTWADVTTSPSALPLDLLAICVVNSKVWWVGTGNSGRMFYTLDGGESDWTQQNFTGSGAGNVRDIVNVKGCLFMVHDSNTPTATLWTSWDGGVDWTAGTPRIQNWPVFDVANRIAVPQVDNPGVAANNVAIAGLAGDGSDGIILLGIAARK